MGCCGSKRRQISGGAPERASRRARPGLSVERVEAPRPRSVAYFEYLGRTGMSVIGPVTRKRYRFEGTGVVVAVDVRDEPYLPAVRHLRKLEALGSRGPEGLLAEGA